MDLDEIIDYIIENDIATQEEVNLVTGINGYSEETVNDIIFYRTGYQDIEQYLESEDEDTYNEYYNNENEEED